MAEGPAGAGAAGPGASIRATLRGLATLAAPTTLVTTLLFYFGWARTSTQAHVMGLDDSLLGFSSQDYILRSISSMFWPLFVAALATLAGLVAHATLMTWVDADDTPRPLRGRRRRLVVTIALTLGAVGALLLLLGVLGARVDEPSRFVSWASPLAVTVSIVLLGYAVYLVQALLVDGRRSAAAARFAGVAPLAWAMVTALLLLSTFWTVSHYAGVKGVDLAVEVERRLPRQPDVTIYSPTRLHLQPPVRETALADEKGAQRYVYSGLKLLFRSDERFFLRPADTGSRRNIVIRDSPDLRFEFEAR